MSFSETYLPLIEIAISIGNFSFFGVSFIPFSFNIGTIWVNVLANSFWYSISKFSIIETSFFIIYSLPTTFLYIIFPIAKIRFTKFVKFFSFSISFVANSIPFINTFFEICYFSFTFTIPTFYFAFIYSIRKFYFSYSSKIINLNFLFLIL